MPHRCSNAECKYFINGCTCNDVDLDADGVCITSRRKREPEYKQMMKYSKPINHTKCGR